MKAKKKLVIILISLSFMLSLIVATLAIVLVSSYQGFNTPFEINYKSPTVIRYNNVSSFDNASAFGNISFSNSYTLEEPTLPIEVNKTIEGWYLDSSYNNKVSFPLTVTETTDLYPRMLTSTISDYLVYNAGGYYELKSENLTDTSITSVVIPDYYNDGAHGNLPVVGLGGETSTTAFLFKNSTVTELYIGNNVTTIPTNFAQSASSLEYVYFGKSLISTGSTCFPGTPIKSVIFPEGFQSIGGSSFRGCTNLEYVYLPNSVNDIQSNTFYNCSSLKSIDIPYCVQSIPFNTFMYCTSLEEIVLPDSVTLIDFGGFINCTSLKRVKLSAGLKTLGLNVFYGCSSLESITIPASVTQIRSNVFSGCTNLTSVTFDNPNGWSIDTDTPTTPTLTDTAQNATYLKETYVSNTWTRS